MPVHKVSETEIRERLKLVATDNDARPERTEMPVAPVKPQPPMRDEAREARNAAILIQATAVLTGLARIVSARAILMLGVIGAFALALFVIHAPTWQALVVMGLYAALVVALVMLESGFLSRVRA